MGCKLIFNLVQTALQKLSPAGHFYSNIYSDFSDKVLGNLASDEDTQEIDFFELRHHRLFSKCIVAA